MVGQYRACSLEGKKTLVFNLSSSTYQLCHHKQVPQPLSFHLPNGDNYIKYVTYIIQDD